MTTSILNQIQKQAATPVNNNRRNGKIARLPKETRDMLNRMLDDGLPYHVIIDELGEAGENLNTQNITNWVQGGYQDYLKQQETIARAKAQMEFATDLLHELPETDPMVMHRAYNLVASTQIFSAILEYGDTALKTLLQDNPEHYLTLINTATNVALASLKLDQHRRDLQSALSLEASSSNQIKVNQGPENNIPAEFPQPANAGGAGPDSPVSQSSQIKVNQGRENNIPAEFPQPATQEAQAQTARFLNQVQSR